MNDVIPPTDACCTVQIMVQVFSMSGESLIPYVLSELLSVYCIIHTKPTLFARFLCSSEK